MQHLSYRKFFDFILTIFIFYSLIGSTAFSAQPISLKEAFESAEMKNEKLAQAHESHHQAEYRVSALRGNLMPNLSFNAYHLIQPRPDDPIAREFSPAQQTTAQLTAVQPLFRGLKEFSALSQQKHVLRAKEALQKDSLQKLYQEVALAYLNVLSFEQDLKNLNEQVEIYTRRIEELRGRTQRGESSATELLSTQSNQNSLQAELRLTQGQLNVAREIFSSLTGKAKDSVLVDPDLIVAAKTESIENYLSKIESRADVQAAVALQDAAEEGVVMARGNHLPTIDATGNYYLKRPGFLKDIKWDVALRLSFPIFSGGSTHAEMQEAVSKNREAELELARVRRLAREDIRTLFETYEARVELLRFLKQSIQFSEKNVEVSQKEFRRGLIRSIDVQQALSEYRIGRRSYDQARFAAEMDLIKLQVAVGQLPTGELK